MNKMILLLFYAFSFFTSYAFYPKYFSKMGAAANSNHDEHITGTKMKVIVGNRTFTTTLYDNATATAFKAKLPLTVSMIELNGNEKYVGLSGNLPTNSANPKTIQAGDLMLYGSSTLVLFYKTFSTPYSYTKLGRIDDVAELANAVGSGNVTITFQLE